jgi:hypothetical protein
MAPGWPHVIQKIFAGEAISGTEGEVLGAIKSWHQHQASICIWLGREFQRRVSVQLSRSHRESQSMRLLEEAEEFVTAHQLRASFHSSALARPVDVIADALRRNVTCRCTIGAPQDRRRYQSRMGWLLEQLPESNLGDTMVHIAWDDGQRTSVSLKRLRSDENEGRIEGALPVAFELSRSFDLAHKFGGQSFSLRAWIQRSGPSVTRLLVTSALGNHDPKEWINRKSWRNWQNRPSER